jgi:tryptophan synthase beta subunit
MINKLPNNEGFFGSYGGQYITEDLKEEFNSIAQNFLRLKDEESFKSEFEYLLKHYVGRPSPVYFAKNLSKKYGADIYLKREDLITLVLTKSIMR